MSKWQLDKIKFHDKEVIFPKPIIAEVVEENGVYNEPETLFNILESVVNEWNEERNKK